MLGYKCNGLDVLVLTGPLVHLFLFSTICWTRPSNPVWNSPPNHSCSCIKGMADIIIISYKLSTKVQWGLEYGTFEFRIHSKS